jgi:putative hemolysin
MTMNITHWSPAEALSNPLKFRVYAPLLMTVRHFTIKTVETVEEMQQALALRYEVFHREVVGDAEVGGSDRDRFDDLADHLVLIDNRNGALIGTYRLISSEFSNLFYSGSEFNLSKFLAKPGIKLELSRACIDKNYRNGLTLTLLWKGIVAYAKKTQAKYLFGCSSVWTMDKVEMAKVVHYLEGIQAFAEDLNMTPHHAYLPEENYLEINAPEIEGSEIQTLIPPLLKTYLKTGAKLGRQPALDRDFRCHDFFTVLDLDNVAYIYERKYL